MQHVLYTTKINTQITKTTMQPVRKIYWKVAAQTEKFGQMLVDARRGFHHARTLSDK